MDLKFVSENFKNLDFYFSKISKILNTEFFQKTFFFVLFLFIIYIIFLLFLNFSFRFIKKFNQKSQRLNVERIKTIIKTIKTIFVYFLIFIFVIFIAYQLRINITTFLTSAGFLGAALVLIFQNSLRDVFTGWILIFEDTFRDGDFVLINNTFKGKVIDFKSRFLVLRGLDGEQILIPYSQINNILNFSRYRSIVKIILKLKKESFSSELLEKIENLIKNLKFEPEKRVSSIHLNKNFNLTPDNQIEVSIYFKVPYQLKDEILFKIKSQLMSELKDDLIEIKNGS